MKIKIFALTFSSLLFTPAFAANGVPSKPLGTGIAYPSLNGSITANAADLPMNPGETCLELFGSPLAPISFGASLAHGGKSFGVGVGYSGLLVGSTLSHNVQ